MSDLIYTQLTVRFVSPNPPLLSPRFEALLGIQQTVWNHPQRQCQKSGPSCRIPACQQSCYHKAMMGSCMKFVRDQLRPTMQHVLSTNKNLSAHGHGGSTSLFWKPAADMKVKTPSFTMLSYLAGFQIKQRFCRVLFQYR